MDTTTNPSQLHHFLSLHCLYKRRRSLLAFLSLSLLLLLAYNGASVFSLQVPFPASFQPENRTGESRNWPSSTKLSSNVIRKEGGKQKTVFKFLRSEAGSDRFSTRVKEFFGSNSCKVRFFMTWISSIDSFRDRELLAVESLFRSHPHGCLIIVSNSMDSSRGVEILRPFLDKGFHVNSISPDFDYLLKHTVAESWFNRLRKGDVDPGEVSLGQNLSNLLRLALLYKFGGVYIDTDVILLKSLSKLRNVIGAQTIDLETGNWSRLNNAVMVFDKGHPLLYKFIEEFALTFDGNKWGHNGPYLVSRVVSRVKGRPGFDFDVLSPMAFYPVDWSRISGLFWGPRNETHLKWLSGKLNHIRSQSYAVHLWNRQSRKIDIEQGSIIDHLIYPILVFSAILRHQS
ncbi:alpha 1,4-glycosyltransferase family protein [Actinidia rufa]|uniref:Alpha 1,4-glycosyltransferase family protein n=1 Tax=Actinidia rufa TaxID=165716 RepID=A0A7J0FWK5_9ERIC|nr:alpha 1,4-glycosyltransferase family protein [Actinidia rufa]